MTEVFEQESTVERWDDDYYHPISLWLYDQAIHDMLRFMQVDVGATVLDAGCGPGVHTIRVAKTGRPVVAIDLSQTMLNHAKQRTQAAGLLDKVQFDQKDLTQLGLPDEKFDYVFSWGVVIHIPQAGEALNHLTRIVKPGGKLALYLTNNKALDHKIESFLRWTLHKPLQGKQRLALGDGIWYDLDGKKLWVWRFDAKAIIQYMASKNFRLIKHHIGELTEIQRRIHGWPRRVLLRLNNLAYRWNLLTPWACTTLFVFEKNKS